MCRVAHFTFILNIWSYVIYECPVAELIATSLRTIWGLETHTWTNLVGSNCKDLHALICDNDILASFLQDGRLLVDEKGLRLSENGLIMADYIIPFVLSNLERQLY